MNSSNAGITGLRPPPSRPTAERSQSTASHRSTSSLGSSASNDSQNAAQTAVKRTGYPQSNPPRPSTAGGAAPTTSTSSLTNFSRPAPRGSSIDDGMKTQRTQAQIGHRPRQHSQGFFEPSLPTASASSLSASAIAAATAMNHLAAPNMGMHERKRSMSGLTPINTAAPTRRAPSPVGPSPPGQLPVSSFHSNGASDDSKIAATTAANAAYPKSPVPTNFQLDTSPLPPIPPLVPEKEGKGKEKSKMKLFSKPKAIGISKDKDLDKKLPSLPSPNKRGLISGFPNASTTSLAESTMSSAASIYSSANASTSTLVPLGQFTTPTNASEKDKDKHRPHFLSRQKHKHGEKFLPLSSASSNSQAVDPSAPQSLYSFTPQSPGANSAFSKSMTGLDLRHGGKGLRDRRKEEKAAASSFNVSSSTVNVNPDYRSEFVGPGSYESSSFLGPPSGTSNNVFSFDQNPTASAAAFNSLGNHMGLSGITPDDAWPLLKARLLHIFEGQPIRTPVEDFNLLVSVHIRRCVQKRAPHILVEDLREFLDTGFGSLAQTLRNLPDDRLVPNLSEMWQMIYCIVLPFIQAVFLPLDLEFRGRGTIMTAEQAADYWGAMPDQFRTEDRPGSAGGVKQLPSLGDELDVRRMTLISFRDIVLMPRHETLLTIFSRLSLDAINAGPSDMIASRSRGASNPAVPGADPPRPGTGGSLSPRLSSYSSQTSTLLDATSSPSQGAFSTNRSRATSNTSAGSFGTSLPHLPSPLHALPAASGTSTPSSATPSATGGVGPGHSRSRSAISVPEPNAASLLSSSAANQGLMSMNVSSAQVTETVARMLQCVSILAGVQTGDAGQSTVERLTGVLKHNWLGRGRTGRQRKGFIGMRVGGGLAAPGMVAAA